VLFSRPVSNRLLTLLTVLTDGFWQDLKLWQRLQWEAF